MLTTTAAPPMLHVITTRDLFAIVFELRGLKAKNARSFDIWRQGECDRKVKCLAIVTFAAPMRANFGDQPLRAGFCLERLRRMRGPSRSTCEAPDRVARPRDGADKINNHERGGEDVLAVPSAPSRRDPIEERRGRG
eukprot:TRINITY_DN9548_c0_g1_i5.p1 TRINITY_DN9548_c0_g1~~TRINITY_DN9548_c0_g1_i5.p1  ORF type:complete len:137 (-),score=9.16 TRINITY_DN9548_c0_g1_i5:74-484(-)